MGLLNNITRLSERAQVQALAATARIEAHIPSYTECTVCGGFDEHTGSGVDITCPACRGLGRIAVDRVAILYGRVSWIDMQKYNVYQGLPTGEIGDCSIQTKLEHTPIVEAVQRTEQAYLLVDGKTLRPVAIIPNRVEALTSLDVRCVIYHREA